MNKIIVNNPKNVINSKIGKNYFKLVGTGGPKGDKGDKGDTGAAATISAGTASSLPAGSSPTVTNSGTSSAAVFNFGIPKGDKGDKGDTGATGAAATITVGSTTTGAAGTNASVTNTGTSGAAVLNFTIPRGDKGETGATGATGATGQAATIAVGSTTTLTPGASATVTNSGTSSAATFNFGIPQGVKGDTGSVKSAYVTSLPSTGNEDTYYLNGDTATTGSVSGTAVQITNADNTGEISDFKLNGNTEQTTYSGKNLINLKPYYFGYFYGNAVGTAINYDITTNADKVSYNVNADGTSSVSSTASWRGVILMSDALTTGTYYFNVDGVSTTANQGASVYVLDNNHIITRQVVNLTGNPITDQLKMAITLENSETYIALGVGCRTTTGTVNLGTFMISQGSTATAYEPYVGGTSAPNPDFPMPISTVSGEQVVKVEGKNLLPTITGSDTYSGVSFTSNNGTVTATGTATASMTFTLTGTDGIKYRQTYWQTILATTTNSVLIPKGTYYFSGTATLGNITIQYRLVDIGQKLEDGTSISLNSSITLTEDKWLCIAIYVNNTRTPDVNMNALQIELGNQATTYEAYRGTDYEVNLGKNLFDYTTITNVQNGTNNGDGTITSNTWSSATWQGITTIFNAISISEPFTISMEIKLSSGSTGTLSKINDGVSNFTSVSSPAVSTTWQKYVYQYTPTAGYSISKFYVQFSAINGSFDIKNIQIEKGTQATTYAPYFTPIELCKIGTYQDYIWNDNGTWKVHKAVGKVDLGSLTYTGGTVNQGYIYSTTGITGIKYVSSNTELGAIISTDYTLHTASGMWDTHGFIAVDTAKVAITNKTASPTGTAYYALATATDTAITESALITQLDNLVSAELLSGVNNIMLVPANQPNGSMSIDYTTWDKHDRYDVYIWNDTIGDYQLIHAGGGNN